MPQTPPSITPATFPSLSAARLINLHDTHGRVPPDAVRIDRRGPWGNPYIISKSVSRADAIASYQAYLAGRIASGAITLESLAGLHGKALACWCAPAPCHGNVLASAAAWAHQTLAS